MTARIANVTFHAEDPIALSRFWPDRAEAWDQDPAHQRFSFTRSRHERRQRNRMHVDITPFDDHRATREELEAERDRLVGLGATVEQVLDGFWGPTRSSRS